MAVLRSSSAKEALQDADVLVEAGFTALELTFTIPDVAVVIRELAGRENVIVGAGTVLSRERADIAVAAGAQFIVSPVFASWFIGAGDERGVLAIPGCASPTEIYAAHDQGAQLVKVFPIARLGGVLYVRDVLAPMPHVKLMVTGGVRPELVTSYLDAGARAVGLGSIWHGDQPRAEAARAAAQIIGL